MVLSFVFVVSGASGDGEQGEVLPGATYWVGLKAFWASVSRSVQENHMGQVQDSINPSHTRPLREVAHWELCFRDGRPRPHAEDYKRCQAAFRAPPTLSAASVGKLSHLLQPQSRMT